MKSLKRKARRDAATGNGASPDGKGPDSPAAAFDLSAAIKGGELDPLFELNPAAMWISDPRGTVIKTNSALRKAMGVPDDRIIGKYNVFKDENLKEPGIRSKIRGVFRKKEAARFELTWRPERAGPVDFQETGELFIHVTMFPVLSGTGTLTHVICQWMNFSGLHTSRMELKRNQERFRSILDSIADPVITSDPDGRITDLNPAAEALTQAPVSRTVGRPLEDILRLHPLPDGLPTIGGADIPTYRVMTKGGERFFSVSTTPLRDDGGRVMVLKDMTDIIRLQSELRISERKYRELFDHSKDGFALFDIQGRFLDANPAYCDMLGYSPDELRAKGDIYAVTPAKWHEWQRREIWDKKLLQRGYSGVYVKEYIRRDGSVFPVELRSFAVKNEEGNIAHLWCIARDISTRQEGEKRLRESRKRYRNMIQTLMEGYYHARPDGSLLDYNPEFARILKLDPLQDHHGTNLTDFWREANDREIYLKQLLETGWVRNYEVHGRRADGENVVLRLNSHIIRNDKGEPVRIDGSLRDITEEFRMREALRESETRFRALFEHMRNSVAVYRAVDDGEDFVFVDVNAAAEKLEGIPRAELIGERISRVFPGVSEMGLLDVFKRVWRTGRAEHLPPVVYRDANKTAWRENFVYKLPAGEIVAIYSDITGLKETEINLWESRERLVRAQRIAGMGDFVYNLESGEITFSQALYDLLQYSKDDRIDLDILNNRLLHPDDREAFTRWLQRGIESKNEDLPPFEHRLQRKDGTIIFVRTRGIFKRSRGKATRLFATIQDISERKRAEITLQTQYERYHTLLQNLKGMVYHCRNDRNWTMNFVSKGCLEVTGYPPEDLVENRKISYNDLILPGQREDIWNIWQEKLPRREAVEIEYQIRRRDGAIRWVWERGRGVFDEKGNLSHLEGFITDITKRKEAESELGKHRNRLETLVEEKTRELRERLTELERFHDATIDREIRMKELRDEIDRLKGKGR